MTNLEWIKTFDIRQFAAFLNKFTCIINDEYIPYCQVECVYPDIDDNSVCANCIERWLNAPHTKTDEWEAAT